MQALPFAMESIIEPELKEIRELAAQDPRILEDFGGSIEDPCPEFCNVLEDFVSWYFKARKTRQSESSILDVAEHGLRIQRKLKEAFPDRQGNFVSVLMLQILYYH